MWHVLVRAELCRVSMIKLSERDHFERLGVDVSWIWKSIFMK